MTERPRPHAEAELVELVRSIDDEAPRHLHERIEAMVADAPRRGSSRQARRGGLRLRIGAAGTAVAAAVVAIALALSGSGGAGGGLSLTEASAVTLRAATMPAPRESPSHRAELTAAVDGIAFPYWGERFGWRSAGSRVDRIAGRTVRTVFYTDSAGHRVGYAIVAGTPAPRDASGAVRWRGGTRFHVSRSGGAEVVSWIRSGHLCIVAGRGVTAATLLTLASWDDVPAAV